MKREYQKLFDQVQAPQRLREEVLQMTKQKQTARPRWLPKAMLAAVLIFVILAGTAIAAVGMPGTLRDWFSREWETLSGAPMTEEQLAFVDALTQPVGKSDTQNGVEVTVDSVTVGNSTMWMLLKVRGDYPVVGETGEEYLYHFSGMDLLFDPDPDQVNTPGGYGMDVPYVAVAEEGVLTMMIRFTIDLAGQSSLLDGSREVTLLLNNLMYSDRVLLEGGWTVTFPLEVNGERTVKTLKEIQVPAMDLDTRETKTVTLYDVEISPTDITYVCSAEDQMWHPMACSLELSDGTVVGDSGGASRFRDEAYTQWSSVYYWQVPVDLEQITAVWFGKTQIPLT